MTRFWWALGVVLILAALVVCLMPMTPVNQPFRLNDKLAHVLGHTALAVYFSGLVARPRWWVLFAFLLVFGVAIEIAQHLMDVGRQGEVRDALGNAAGAALGLGLGRAGLARWPAWMNAILGRRAVP